MISSAQSLEKGKSVGKMRSQADDVKRASDLFNAEKDSGEQLTNQMCAL